MKIILLSGGSGKRLWPLSNQTRAKQFLRLLNGKKKMESMLERIWGQLKTVNLADSVYIASTSSQVDLIQNQLGTEAPLIIEPMQRDTFAAITSAIVYLSSVEGISQDEVICIIPVDPYVELDFFEKIKELEEIIEQGSDIDMALIGIHPTYPSEKYGYIVPKLSPTNRFHPVSRFVEKPQTHEAEKLVKQNAWWNAGVFAFRLKFMIQFLAQKGIPIQYDDLIAHYNQLPRNSFDYEVIEKLERLVVLPYQGSWKDLGTWNTLTEEMGTTVIGEGMIQENSKNTFLINELDIPIISAGLSNTVIAASPDGILVCELSSSPKIKEMVEKIKQRPMYEEKRWGTYRILDFHAQQDHMLVLTKLIQVTPGKNLSYQVHNKRSEIWTIIKGTGEFILDGKISLVKQGDVVKIPIGAKHGIKAITELEFIEVQMGSELVEEDILRIAMAWEEIRNEHANQ
ncbi:MAG TPA: sugar phosphate nucleotidyltransferase [Bacillota bacterium]|nr:sugar phosphate nucleotidyltransferase [Bacillota bacterium]